MKILKSGVEMTPEDKTKIRGGSCSCFCDTRYVNGTSFSVPGQTQAYCFCSCDSPGDNGQDAHESAYKYIL